MTQTVFDHPKLDETQPVFPSAAATGADGALLPLPKNLKTKGAARTRAIDRLLGPGLIAVAPGAPVRHRDANGPGVGLSIAAAELTALDPRVEQSAGRRVHLWFECQSSVRGHVPVLAGLYRYHPAPVLQNPYAPANRRGDWPTINGGPMGPYAGRRGPCRLRQE